MVEDKRKKMKTKKKYDNGEKLKMKIIYNDEKLNTLRNKQIKKMKGQIKEIEDETKAKIKNVKKEGRRIPGIVKFRKKKKEYLKEEKEKKIKELNGEIEKLEKMDIIDNLRNTKKKKIIKI